MSALPSRSRFGTDQAPVLADLTRRRWPVPLQLGDVVSVVAPSGPCDADRTRAGAEVLQSCRLDVRYGRHALGRHERLSYLSADDRTRADDFTAAWTDPDTAAVWAARGGYGAQRMVDLIDYDALRAAGESIGSDSLTSRPCTPGSVVSSGR